MSTAMPMSRIAVCPASGTSWALGSLTVPSKVGSVAEVMSSPTMLVSLAGSSCERARETEGGVVLMMNESKKLPPG